MLPLVDEQLFLFFNSLPHTPGLDSLAMAISGIGNAGLIWIALALFLFFREERRGWSFFAPFLTAGFLASAASELILKPFVGRVRPAQFLLDAVVIGQIPRTFSFPSTHATLAWALATVIAAEDPRIGRFAYILAALISLSRIYLGMHFPLDVAVGALLGWGIGMLCVVVFYAPPKKKKARAKKIR
jgi:undecaprenyl-diphosphatase